MDFFEVYTSIQKSWEEENFHLMTDQILLQYCLGVNWIGEDLLQQYPSHMHSKNKNLMLLTNQWIFSYRLVQVQVFVDFPQEFSYNFPMIDVYSLDNIPKFVCSLRKRKTTRSKYRITSTAFTDKKKTLAYMTSNYRSISKW